MYRQFFRRFNIEPLLFMYAICVTLTNVVEYQMFVTKLCIFDEPDEMKEASRTMNSTSTESLQMFTVPNVTDTTTTIVTTTTGIIENNDTGDGSASTMKTQESDTSNPGNDNQRESEEEDYNEIPTPLALPFNGGDETTGDETITERDVSVCAWSYNKTYYHLKYEFELSKMLNFQKLYLLPCLLMVTVLLALLVDIDDRSTNEILIFVLIVRILQSFALYLFSMQHFVETSPLYVITWTSNVFNALVGGHNLFYVLIVSTIYKLPHGSFFLARAFLAHLLGIFCGELIAHGIEIVNRTTYPFLWQSLVSFLVSVILFVYFVRFVGRLSTIVRYRDNDTHGESYLDQIRYEERSRALSLYLNDGGTTTMTPTPSMFGVYTQNESFAIKVINILIIMMMIFMISVCADSIGFVDRSLFVPAQLLQYRGISFTRYWIQRISLHVSWILGILFLTYYYFKRNLSLVTNTLFVILGLFGTLLYNILYYKVSPGNMLITLFDSFHFVPFVALLIVLSNRHYSSLISCSYETLQISMFFLLCDLVRIVWSYYIGYVHVLDYYSESADGMTKTFLMEILKNLLVCGLFVPFVLLLIYRDSNLHNFQRFFRSERSYDFGKRRRNDGAACQETSKFIEDEIEPKPSTSYDTTIATTTIAETKTAAIVEPPRIEKSLRSFVMNQFSKRNPRMIVTKSFRRCRPDSPYVKSKRPNKSQVFFSVRAVRDNISKQCNGFIPNTQQTINPEQGNSRTNEKLSIMDLDVLLNELTEVQSKFSSSSSPQSSSSSVPKVNVSAELLPSTRYSLKKSMEKPVSMDDDDYVTCDYANFSTQYFKGESVVEITPCKAIPVITPVVDDGGYLPMKPSPSDNDTYLEPIKVVRKSFIPIPVEPIDYSKHVYANVVRKSQSYSGHSSTPDYKLTAKPASVPSTPRTMRKSIKKRVTFCNDVVHYPIDSLESPSSRQESVRSELRTFFNPIRRRNAKKNDDKDEKIDDKMIDDKIDDKMIDDKTEKIDNKSENNKDDDNNVNDETSIVSSVTASPTVSPTMSPTMSSISLSPSKRDSRVERNNYQKSSRKWRSFNCYDLPRLPFGMHSSAFMLHGTNKIY